MSSITRDYQSASDCAQEIVALYAPLTKGSMLPSYKQPDITWKIDASCHPDFAALMKSLSAKLDLNDRTQFSDDECRLFRYQRLHGLHKLYRQGLSGQQLLLPEAHHAKRYAMCSGFLTILLGDKILSLLDHDQYETWFPWHDFSCVPSRSDRQFTFRCVSLPRHVMPDGRLAYYSAQRHTVTIRGKTRIVAFYTHAIQRIAERLVWTPRSYGDLGDIFALVNHCQYFEPAQLYPQQDAFTFFEDCTRSHFSGEYARQILDHLDPQTKYAYRVGYCPMEEEGDFFVAKTVLVPGYTATPEYGALLQSTLDPTVKAPMLARCRQLSYPLTAATQDFALLHWFHTHGVPQVITPATPLFDNETWDVNPQRFNLVAEL